MKNVTVVSNKSFRQIPSDFCLPHCRCQLGGRCANCLYLFPLPPARQADDIFAKLPWPCLCVLACVSVCVCLCMQNTSIFCAVIPTGIINYPSRAAPKRHRLFVSLRVPQNVATVLAATLTSQCRLTWQSTPRKRHREWRKGRGWKAGLRCGCCWQLAESLAERKIKSQR